MHKKRPILSTLLLLIIFLALASCAKPVKNEVVIYTSCDQVYAEPILQKFEKKTGIKVRALYDVEAAKTTGLVNRLMAEKDKPVADVFWNGEFVQTMFLKEKELLEKYQSPNAGDIPPEFKDEAGYWTGFGGRARIIIVNTELLAEGDYPSSINDILEKKYPADKVALAYPLFGTTLSQAAALYAVLGEEKASELFEKIKHRNVRVVDGNSVVRDLVASGAASWGLTDTDDAFVAIKQGKPVKIVFPDQQEKQIGTLVIPNTVCLIKNSPHRENGQKLIDYLLSIEVEEKLISMGQCQLSARAKSQYDLKAIKKMNLSFEAIYQELGRTKEDLSEIFIK